MPRLSELFSSERRHSSGRIDSAGRRRRPPNKELPVNATAEDYAEFRPCLILAHADPVLYAPGSPGLPPPRLGRVPRPDGAAGAAARAHAAAAAGRPAGRLARGKRLAHLRQADGRIPDHQGRPRRRRPDADQADFADFVGAAALANRRDGMAALLPRVRRPRPAGYRIRRFP